MNAAKFFTKAEAEKATIEFFQHRNAGRGQYPKSISPKHTLREINPDGTTLYTYTYKGETVEMLCGCYHTEVAFDVPSRTYTL